MVDSLPTGSVTGKDDWEWNRLQANRQSAAAPQRPRSPMPRVAEQPRPPREVQAVAAELERSQRRLQTVIDRYEALLTEKDRRLARAADEGPTSAPSERVIQALRRLVARR